ncbi:hypothetical protein SVAN01_07183 [Stagonosporopsis vannaccii]|nr:hypothetical protein SVAN01_07183 [Stagonosporopsis vannaccii]
MAEEPVPSHVGSGEKATSSPTRKPFEAQKSRASIKARRSSRLETILDSIQGTHRGLYSFAPLGEPDLSTAPHLVTSSGYRPSSLPTPAAIPESAAPTSLYTLLARYLNHLTETTTKEAPFTCTLQEMELLQHEGLTQEVVQSWALSLLETNCDTAARIFRRDAGTPPFFLVLLYLRRKHIRRPVLSVVLTHISARLHHEPVNWDMFKILAARVLRHARRQWPEALPWLSSLFLDKAAKMHGSSDNTDPVSPRSVKEITRFCNNLLSLLSLPSSLRPMIASRHQQTAQFRVLQFMAGCDPSIAVTRTGFRAIARIQLTHAKTDQERDWAELKGHSWPPWKESRTAMDDDKGYEQGASRASKILHRMFEAGYAARNWEEVAEVYAGWDTDLSPTIQTRALLPIGFRGDHIHRLWAARIRTTRTRREAWACFLAYEASGAAPDEGPYLAMFEKLYYAEVQRRPDSTLYQAEDASDVAEPSAPYLLPGDMKEVVADSSSPLHNVYLSEAVPTYEELYQRMMSKDLQPRERLLSFLMETYPDFATIFKLLEKAKNDFQGGVGCLLYGNHGDTSTVHKLPDYFLAAFMRFLCRFGRQSKTLSASTAFLAPDQHRYQIMFDDHYLLKYAFALLLHYKPRHQPAWTAFMERIVFDRFRPMYQEKDSAMGITNFQYDMVAKLLDTLASVDVDVEGDLFILACTATRYAAQAVHRRNLSTEQRHEFLATRSYRLRKLFHHLAGGHADQQTPAHTTTIPPHVPGPAELHAYVRALGILRDYEGLYSFSTWLTKHAIEVIARARAQHGGSDMLFRTLVALRAATGGWLEEGLDSRPKAPEDIKELIKAQISSVKEWGGWPSNRHVEMYIQGHVRSATPEVGGR